METETVDGGGGGQAWHSVPGLWGENHLPPDLPEGGYLDPSLPGLWGVPGGPLQLTGEASALVGGRMGLTRSEESWPGTRPCCIGRSTVLQWEEHSLEGGGGGGGRKQGWLVATHWLWENQFQKRTGLDKSSWAKSSCTPYCRSFQVLPSL